MRVKTNKIFVIAIVLTMLIPLQGCDEDKLEITNPNTVSQEAFFSNESDFRLAVNGMIHPITAVLFWGRVVHTGALLRSDAFNVLPFQQNTTMSTLNGSPGDRWASDMYPQLYQTIRRANTIIEEADEEVLPPGDARNEILGQAYFMRAFAHWYLGAFYGNVPIVLKVASQDNPDEVFPTQSTQQEVFNAVVEDLGTAAQLLPESWPASDLGRATRGAALALRGKTNLYLGNYAAAETDLQAVVDSGVYSLLPAERYRENFGSGTTENNEESVFELQFSPQEAFVWGSDSPQTGTQTNFHIDYSPPLEALDRSHFINPHILDAFENNNDTLRRNATIAFDYPGAKGYGNLPFLEDFSVPDPEEMIMDDLEMAASFGVPALFTRKYSGMDSGFTRDEIPGFGQILGNNWRIIRYADVLLMLAEAKNENTDTPGAVTLINEVRARALIDPTMAATQNEVFDAIVEERIMELTGEGHRYLDLVRWGLADDVMGQGSTIAGGNHPKSLAGSNAFFTTGQDEFIWIPISELNANPNLEQNDGY